MSGEGKGYRDRGVDLKSDVRLQSMGVDLGGPV